MKQVSKTNWQALDQMQDHEVDLSDIAELGEAFFEQAIRIPPKQPVTIRLDSDVLSWFKSQGQGYQTRINKLLRNYMESQQ